MAEFYENFTNEEIRAELVKRGIAAGPVGVSTRNVYIKKLIATAAGGDASLSTVVNGSSEGVNARESRAKSLSPVNDIDVADVSTNGITEENTPANDDIGHESEEEGDHQEYSRVLTPEECAARFRSPMKPRRKQLKTNQKRLTYILAAVFAVLVAMVIANVLGYTSIKKPF